MTEPKKPQPSKKLAKAVKAKKPAFDLEALKVKAAKLTETQWAMIAGVIFLLGYVLFEFVLATPPGVVTDGMNAQVQQRTQETEEERFKRENANAHLPDGKNLPKDLVASKTQLTQQTPFGDSELDFVVRLPKDWVMSEFARYGLQGQDNYKVLTNVARYFGPAIEDARPFLYVDVERIKRYMTAETWARAYMIKHGISPQAVQVISPTEVQALYVDVRDFQSYAVRGLFRIVSDTIVMASMGVPISSYKDKKDVMGLVLNSFRLTNPINREIEKKNEYNLLNILRLKYFSSWMPKNEFTESMLRPSVELHNPQEANNTGGKLLQGIILINIWRNSSQFNDENNMKEIKDRLQVMSMTLGKALDKAKALPVRDNFTAITQTPYLAQVNSYVQTDKFGIDRSESAQTKQEVWVTVLDNGYYRAYATLITPPKETNYVIWNQNMSAYQLLLDTMQLRGAPTAE